jgi:lipid II:glycine glycyltransferase (peptidoglycan interpeptide bridge formation enzyme)
MTIAKLQDVRQTKQYSLFLNSLGWQTVIIKKCKLYYKKLPLFPLYLGKMLRCHHLPNRNDLIKTKKIINKKVFFVFIKTHPFKLQTKKLRSEEKRKLLFFKKDNHPLIPTKTIFIDLKKDVTSLKKDLKQKVRYNLKQTQKGGVYTKTVLGNKITQDQLKSFYWLWSKNKPFNFIFKPCLKELKSLSKAFLKNCFFVFAFEKRKNSKNKKGKTSLFKNQKPIAQALFLTSKNMACYWHNASSKQGRKLFAPTLVLWQGIKQAKKKSLRVFDLDGIYDDRFKTQTGWKGFSRFKQGFGGKVVLFKHPLSSKFL